VGRATGRDGWTEDWTDLDGRERSHRLLAVSELRDIDLSAVQRAFIDALANGPSPHR
jgi:hypothetical protein